MDEGWIDGPFRPVSKTDELGKVLGWLRGETDKSPVIMDGKRPYAIVNARALMGRGMNRSSHLHKVAQPVPVLDPAATLEQVLEAFDGSLAPYLPVGNKNGVAGIVTAQRVLAEAFEAGPDAGDALGRPPVPTLSPGDRIEDASHAFAKTSADRLPVVDKGRIVGVLPRRTVILIEEFESQGAGKRDFGGESVDVRAEPVEGRMEEGWSECRTSLPFSELVGQLGKQGYVFVVDGQGKYRGTLTPTLVLRAARVHALLETRA